MSYIVVLNDGETFSAIEGCKVLYFDADEIDPGDIDTLESAIKNDELDEVANLTEPIGGGEERWWTNWAAESDENTVVPAVSKVLGHTVHGIVDEAEGGMIAYAPPDIADRISTAMNLIEPKKEKSA